MRPHPGTAPENVPQYEPAVSAPRPRLLIGGADGFGRVETAQAVVVRGFYLLSGQGPGVGLLRIGENKMPFADYGPGADSVDMGSPICSPVGVLGGEWLNVGEYSLAEPE